MKISIICDQKVDENGFSYTIEEPDSEETKINLDIKAFSQKWVDCKKVAKF